MDDRALVKGKGAGSIPAGSTTKPAVKSIAYRQRGDAETGTKRLRKTDKIRPIRVKPVQNPCSDFSR
jgi:hypothetical protein